MESKIPPSFNVDLTESPRWLGKNDNTSFVPFYNESNIHVKNFAHKDLETATKLKVIILKLS